MSSDLLIFYCPGSRGDFLAAVLTDQILHCYQQYSISFPGTYHKMHGFGDINPWDKTLGMHSILQHNSIRIKICPDDVLPIVSLIKNKQLPMMLTKEDVIKWEQRHRMLDSNFKHAVRFADLFEVEFLKDFYQHYNQRPIPQAHIPLIEHNIALQLCNTN